ncbi:HAD family hydrolase [Bacillus carboniphilus]|uniref:HAD family hydrolase n=1 Tax=Bacillus carboniphilus TaxID=86663 RepID=A0ABY9JV50_9BACI|nr:HAD family hydrolase [Bacillus carboniphilus]WLR42659.1 HAD family hydrolase [Bacillus carboniphilus]
MIKAVLFDLDGTLLNRDESVKCFITNQYDRFQKFLSHLSKEDYVARFIELDKRGYVWKDKVYQKMVDEFNLQLSWEVFLEDYITMFKHHCHPFPNLFDMLEKLKEKEIRLGMITNGKNPFQMDNIEALKIRDYFDVILISEEEGIKKPNPDIFHRALKKLDVSSHESMFVGDNPMNDVNGAQEVGMIGIWKRDPEWIQVEADYVVEDLLELTEIIEEHNSKQTMI